jgi:hypothetical protein
VTWQDSKWCSDSRTHVTKITNGFQILKIFSMNRLLTRILILDASYYRDWRTIPLEYFRHLRHVIYHLCVYWNTNNEYWSKSRKNDINWDFILNCKFLVFGDSGVSIKALHCLAGALLLIPCPKPFFFLRQKKEVCYITQDMPWEEATVRIFSYFHCKQCFRIIHYDWHHYNRNTNCSIRNTWS